MAEAYRIGGIDAGACPAMPRECTAFVSITP
jgi:hypothetical protein